MLRFVHGEVSGLISVVIPTFNRGVFIERVIRSVLEQKYNCHEILVVDDGSTDETERTVELLAAVAAIPIRYFFQENSGAAAARNRGIKESRGDVICFVDSDDWWDREKIEIQYAAMQSEPEYLISHTQEIWYRNGKRVNQKKKHAPQQGYILPQSLAMCVVGMSTVMARREVFTLYGLFDESLLCCEDYEFWLRISPKESFLLVPQPLTFKDGGRPDQLSAIHRMGMDTYRIRAICKLLDSGTLNDDESRLAVDELQRKCVIYGNGCLKHGRMAEGDHYLGLPSAYK